MWYVYHVHRDGSAVEDYHPSLNTARRAQVYLAELPDIVTVTVNPVWRISPVGGQEQVDPPVSAKTGILSRVKRFIPQFIKNNQWLNTIPR